MEEGEKGDQKEKTQNRDSIQGRKNRFEKPRKKKSGRTESALGRRRKRKDK